MTLIGYARCSTSKQDETRQVQALKDAGCDPIHLEHASGKTLDREVLQQVLADLSPGDTLVIHELDRLGRSMIQMLQCAESLVERGIGLITLDGKLNTETMDPSIVKLIVGVLEIVDLALHLESLLTCLHLQPKNFEILRIFKIIR